MKCVRCGEDKEVLLSGAGKGVGKGKGKALASGTAAGSNGHDGGGWYTKGAGKVCKASWAASAQPETDEDDGSVKSAEARARRAATAEKKAKEAHRRALLQLQTAVDAMKQLRDNVVEASETVEAKTKERIAATQAHVRAVEKNTTSGTSLTSTLSGAVAVIEKCDATAKAGIAEHMAKVKAMLMEFEEVVKQAAQESEERELKAEKANGEKRGPHLEVPKEVAKMRMNKDRRGDQEPRRRQETRGTGLQTPPMQKAAWTSPLKRRRHWQPRQHLG